MHRKRFAVFMVVVASLFTLVASACTPSASSPAVAPSTHGGKVKVVQLKPYFTATGGGCNQGTDNWQVGDSASLSACISGYGDLFTWHVNPDGYASFSTQVPLAWTDCTVTFKLIDQTNGNRVVESLQQSCLSDAQHNHTGVHYVVGQYGQGICPLRFQTLGELQGHYGGTTIDFTVSSPTKFINC